MTKLAGTESRFPAEAAFGEEDEAVAVPKMEPEEALGLGDLRAKRGPARLSNKFI